MNILMIDNYSIHSDELEVALRQYGDVRRVKFRHHSRLDRTWADLIVLSGSHIKGAFAGLFSKELALIRMTTKPVIGICYGFELIAVAYGDTVTRTDTFYNGVFDVTLRPEFLGNEYKTRFEVIEAHRYVLEKTNALVPMGMSERGIEAFRHPSRPLFGIQFHPEVTVPKNDGTEILRRLIHYVRLINAEN